MNAKKTIDISGCNKGEALVVLIREGMDMKEAEDFWKENGFKRGKQGFRARFYEECLKTDFDRDSLLTYMAGNEASGSDIKGVTHFLAISELVTRAKAQ